MQASNLKTNKKIYISGMHSGQNPSSGTGIARCLRKAFPSLTLVGVDHWQGSSGLHDPAIDEVLLLPQWKQMNYERHREQFSEILDKGNIWISALDVEVYWLAQNFGAHKNLLAPTGAALKATCKPSVSAFTHLGFEVPEFISAYLSDSEVHSFLRHNSWQCWLKGPYHDAARIVSWDSFERARDAMEKEWNTTQLFVQRHKIGNEETICFAAHHGELVSAVKMEKRLITPGGKTWSGRVTPVSDELFEGLKEALRRLEWSGGGEIEYTRDPDGRKWIIECNPRFPAWINGAALLGINLPARLIARALNVSFFESQSKYPFFTRVVQEIAAKESVGIPLPSDPSLMALTAEVSKGKSGPAQAHLIPILRDTMELRLVEENEEVQNQINSHLPDQVPQNYLDEIKVIADSFTGETPSRVHLEHWTSSRFQTLLESVNSANKSTPEIRIGYSVKTSPTDKHLTKAIKSDFYIECISQLEVHRALTSGVAPADIILNGPGKFWPMSKAPVTGLHMLFCDSIEEFERVLLIPNIASCIGARIQLPRLSSRFGISIDEFDKFEKLAECVRNLKGKAALGFHFHMPSWAIGMKRWNEALHSLLTWCQSLEQITKVKVQRLDLGGGFFPADLQALPFTDIQKSVKAILPHVEGIYFEPGRSLTQEGEVIFSRVLDVRKTAKNKLHEVVVDACIAELPLIQSYSHRMFYKSNSKSEEKQASRILAKGDTPVLGRICMENDVLSRGLDLPENVNIGDYIIFGDAGAYERSMSYDFGRG